MGIPKLEGTRVNRLILRLPTFVVVLPLLGYFLVSPPPPDSKGSGGGFAVPEVSLDGALPNEAEMERLANSDPILFLENCLRRYHRDVKGYHLTMQKQERINGSLHAKEIVDVYFKEQPHSVFMIWREGSYNAERSLYVEDETNPKRKVLARPNSAAKRLIAGNISEQDVDGILPKQSGRFTLDQFGLKKATERYLASWKAAKDKGELDVKFVGLHALPEANNKVVYHFLRKCAVPENDGVMEQTLYIDKATWLQLGSVIKGKKGELIGEYYFCDIEINPPFKPNQFQREALIP
jgi:hypothetical protein